MPNYRRATTAGGTYFFTLVTYQRRNLFADDWVINRFKQSLKEVKLKSPFEIDAWVILPDHMHCVWTLPKDDSNYSKRIGQIKANFSSQMKKHLHENRLLTDSRKEKGESSIWQRRFWEHQIRDQKDFEKHLDYVHYNPVKHGLVQQVADWPYSTFHQFVKQGVYPINWSGITEDSSNYGE